MKIPDKIHNVFCSFLSIFFRSRTIKHILNLNGNEKKEFLKKIIDENIKQSKFEPIEYLTQKSSSFKFVQSYNQLPCTVETRKKRADLFERNGFREKEILLMGDDDMVSVELASRNFKHITVLDCDITLLKKLKILTQDAKFPVTFFHVDLYEGLPAFLNHIFDVVIFDPPQNYNDLSIFMNCAIKSLKYTNSSFYMMVNSIALGRKNKDRLISQLQIHGFTNTQKFDFFNSYPLNRGQSWLLKLMSHFTHNYSARKKGVACKYYFTDCLEFKSNSYVQSKEQFIEEKQIIAPVVGHFTLPDIPIAFFKEYRGQNKKSIN
jgi:N4-bis(aminopropyl)spermidine synthase